MADIYALEVAVVLTAPCQSEFRKQEEFDHQPKSINRLFRSSIIIRYKKQSTESYVAMTRKTTREIIIIRRCRLP
jgi:aspartyl/asparaginyl beta-hydroxylase (cupin superfamily)